jgi:ring-1,2-phenylacetyl-CoA epoxidase subunit PaaC
MATAETLGTPEELSEREQGAVEALMFRLADDEFVLAERYTEWQVRAPTLESDLAVSNIAQDELGHARLWYDLLEDFGYEESDLLWERDPDDFKHSTLVELPFAEGDWADCIVRGYLYDVAEHLQLEALVDTSYPRLADRVGKVLREEEYHREHASNWLERLTSSEEGRERIQDAVGRLFPHALTLFEPVSDDEGEDAVDDLGLRTDSLESMREQWLDTVVPFLESLGVQVPMDPDDEVADLLPDEVGRDGSHTDHWPDLHAEFTRTYRELGRTGAGRIMKDPDDE